MFLQIHSRQDSDPQLGHLGSPNPSYEEQANLSFMHPLHMVSGLVTTWSDHQMRQPGRAQALDCGIQGLTRHP